MTFYIYGKIKENNLNDICNNYYTITTDSTFDLLSKL